MLLDTYKSSRMIYNKLRACGFKLPARQFFTRRFLQGLCNRKIQTLHISELTRDTLMWTRRVKKSTTRELMAQVKGNKDSCRYVDPAARLYDRHYLICVLFKTQAEYMDKLMREVNAVMYKKKTEKLLLTTMPGDIFAALFDTVNQDPNKKAKFSQAMFRPKTYKYRSQSSNN
eukprot:Mrub_12034.p1 GENE.Mrub_12034~~Mrub_12034.p1  ORF type:complete len:194 (+),score=27.97 Mrub_12034:66-584(+)